MRFRYSRWDGTQDPLGPDLSAGDVLEAMSDDLLSGQSVDRTLSQLMRRGLRGRFSGLDALRARLRQARRHEQEQLNLEGPLREIQERLAEILEEERRTLSFKAEDDARMREQFLDSLPPDPAGQVRELKDYRFVDAGAQRKFDELLEWLKEQVLGSYFRGMAEGMRNVSPEQLQRFKDMLSELNSMIEARDRGKHTQADFHAFMRRHGDFFPDNPKTLDELLEALARGVLQDLDLAFEVDRLSSSLNQLFPELPWGDPVLSGGEEAMPMQATVDALERMSDFEDLDRSMRADYAGASLEDIDEDRLRRTLGEDAVRDLRRLKQVERALEQAGLVERTRGRLQVTPKGA